MFVQAAANQVVRVATKQVGTSFLCEPNMGVNLNPDKEKTARSIAAELDGRGGGSKGESTEASVAEPVSDQASTDGLVPSNGKV